MGTDNSKPKKQRDQTINYTYLPQLLQQEDERIAIQHQSALASKTPLIRNGKLLAATDENLKAPPSTTVYNVPAQFPRKLALLTAKTYVSLAKIDHLRSS